MGNKPRRNPFVDLPLIKLFRINLYFCITADYYYIYSLFDMPSE